MKNPLNFPLLPNGDIDELSEEWQQHVLGCIEAAASMDEISTDDYAYVEHTIIAKWNKLDPADQLTHTLSTSELYLTVQRAKKAQQHMRNLLLQHK